MKRSLRNTQQQKNNSNISANNLNASQKQQFDKLKSMAKNYEGKSENEILGEIKKTVEKGKKDGSLSDNKINEIANQISPMLNDEQKAKLNLLLKSLKK